MMHRPGVGLAFFFLASSAAVAQGQVTYSQPNVVVFLVDDMGWGDSRVYNPESLIAMPNLEQLAAEGMRFTDAHTSAAKCAPTRYSVLTGNYHWRGRSPWGEWHYLKGNQILPGQLTLASMLGEAGYQTAMIGKSHLGSRFYRIDSDEFARQIDPETLIDFGRGMVDGPIEHGFDFTYLALRGIQKSPFAFFADENLVGDPDELIEWPRGNYGFSEIDFDGIGSPTWDSSEVGPQLMQQAQTYIAQAKEPFFLHYNTQSAHLPFTPPNNFLDVPVRGETGISNHADMIYEIDVALGYLLAALDDRGITDNTLIVFTSDNGGQDVMNNLGHDSMAGLRGKKGDIWEGGHRVPLIVKWANQIPANSSSDQLIGLHDLMATLAGVVGVGLPAEQARDSFYFLPVLLGEDNDNPVRDHLIMEGETEDRTGKQFAFRQAGWKLILDRDGAPKNLFDLDSDVFETNDLFATEPERVTQMYDDYQAYRALERTAPLSDVDRDGVADEADNCTQVMNADQRDSNADGFGNVCDADLDNDGVINFSDLAQMKLVFFSDDPDADLDGNGAVDFSDLGLMKSAIFSAPGPSGSVMSPSGVF